MECGRRKRRRQRVFENHILCQHIVSFFVLASVLQLMLSNLAQARTVPNPSEATLSQGEGEEDGRIMRSRIGSRPPRCAGRCYSCGHCEAIQVPTNPQVAKLARATSTTKYFRGDYGSNYKPMSWKCKCGNYIFNP